MPPDPVVDLARAWVAKAAGDLAMARAGHAAPDAPGWAVAFHCQQAVEKCLKARLVLAGIEPPVSHDLKKLVHLAAGAAADFPLTMVQLAQLQPFAVAERYPVLTAQGVGRGDVERLLGYARLAVAWAEAMVASRGS